MKFGSTAVLGALAVLSLGSAARAADYDGTYLSDQYRVRHESAERGDPAHDEGRRIWRHGPHDAGRSPDRYYGRPVPEHSRWARPVFARPGWGDRDECRVIIKERVNRWGERITRRTQICG